MLVVEIAVSALVFSFGYAFGLLRRPKVTPPPSVEKEEEEEKETVVGGPYRSEEPLVREGKEEKPSDPVPPVRILPYEGNPSYASTCPFCTQTWDHAISGTRVALCGCVECLEPHFHWKCFGDPAKDGKIIEGEPKFGCKGRWIVRAKPAPEDAPKPENAA